MEKNIQNDVITITEDNELSNSLVDYSSGTYENLRINVVPNIRESEPFLKYIDWLGIGKDQNLIVLSSQHHYYYDLEELINVHTLVNIKQLNRIDNIEDFLRSIFHSLPKDTNFIGCFEDNRKSFDYLTDNELPDSPTEKENEYLENGIISKRPFLNVLFSFLDAKTFNLMSKKGVSTLMKNHGFRVLNFSDQNGLTYFHAKSI